MNTKKFQQYLSEPGVLEKFIKNKDTAEAIRATYVNQYAFGPKVLRLFEIKS